MKREEWPLWPKGPSSFPCRGNKLTMSSSVCPTFLCKIKIHFNYWLSIIAKALIPKGYVKRNMISCSPNCLRANRKDRLINKPYREQRKKKWKRAVFNANCGLGEEPMSKISNRDANIIAQRALVEQLNEMFSCSWGWETGLVEGRSWRPGEKDSSGIRHGLY